MIFGLEVVRPKIKPPRTVIKRRSTVHRRKAVNLKDVGSQVGNTVVTAGKAVEIIEGNIVGIIDDSFSDHHLGE
jgi:hypothetical protein